MKTLIIDNYDSYTFNLLQLFDKDSQVVVIRNDQFTWNQFTKQVLPHFDNVIISPGPGRPDKISDFGLCTDLLKAQLDPNMAEYHRPIFAICLGHQGIGHFMGGKVTYAPRIMHGRMSLIHCQSTQAEYKDIMYNCSSPFWAVRYHSLVVDRESMPSDLLLTAYCYENDADMEALKSAPYIDDSETYCEKNNHFLEHCNQQDNQTDTVTVMGFQHRKLPLWGVQFHPESAKLKNTEFEKFFHTHTHRELVLAQPGSPNYTFLSTIKYTLYKERFLYTATKDIISSVKLTKYKCYICKSRKDC
ncbi:class I glutamine amidotransferase-like protein [Backusella circina FSU 941]|nr:class I glutamine amidotransferase-like protein [Backusella circina FSU 941]